MRELLIKFRSTYGVENTDYLLFILKNVFKTRYFNGTYKFHCKHHCFTISPTFTLDLKVLLNKWFEKFEKNNLLVKRIEINF